MGPNTGATATAMPYSPSTIVCCRRGNVLNRIVCDKGTTGAPAPPWMIRQNTSISSDCAMPHSKVATVKTAIDQTITGFSPKRATSQPVIGVTMAVARMLNVMVQAISSWVADIAPCICGRMVEVVRMAVPYSDDASTTAPSVSNRCSAVRPPATLSGSVLAAVELMPRARSFDRL